MGKKGKNKNKSNNEAATAEPEKEEEVPVVSPDTKEGGDSPAEENKQENSKIADAASTTAGESSEGTASKEKDTSDKDDTTNDGVKILEEVFGKTNAESTGSDTPSVSSADEGSAPKVEPKEEAKQASASQESAPSMGPAAPSEDDFDEEEIKKAEEFKTQGNDFFKSK